MPATLKKDLRTAAISAGLLVALWAALVAAPMWLTRWRMAHLLADYQALRPMQSTWAEANPLISRWKRWGRSQGTCNSAECLFEVRLEDPLSRFLPHLPERFAERFSASPLPLWLGRLGYRAANMEVDFSVLNGLIIRTRSAMTLEVADSGPPDHFAYAIRISAISHPNLRSPGPGSQLALHPDYRVDRPSGGGGNIVDWITYTPALPHETAVQLASYNLRCLTQWHPCTSIGDLLPFGSGWRLWEGGPSTLYPATGIQALPCRTEPRALARDAVTVLEVETLSSLPVFDAFGAGIPRERLRVHILQVWKAPLRDDPGPFVDVSPAPIQTFDGYTTAPDHLYLGHRAFLFLADTRETDFSRLGDHSLSAFDLAPCGVIEDNASNLAAIERGIAQDRSDRLPPESR